MTKISQYPTISEPQLDDLLIGTDKNNSDETKNFSIQSIVDLVPGVVAPAYKSYRAIISQSETNAPVANVLENTISEDLSWQYSSTGEYLLISSNEVFTPETNNINLLINQVFTPTAGYIHGTVDNAQTYRIYCFTPEVVATDGIILKQLIEIYVPII